MPVPLTLLKVALADGLMVARSPAITPLRVPRLLKLPVAVPS